MRPSFRDHSNQSNKVVCHVPSAFEQLPGRPLVLEIGIDTFWHSGQWRRA
jgi:hypothetical protein